MTAWERVTVPATLCGRCGRLLQAGDPVFVITIRTIRKIRCANDQCAGPAPPDLPALVVRTHAITPTPLRRVAPLLPLGTPLADFRMRQTGEREPGEDDDQ